MRGSSDSASEHLPKVRSNTFLFIFLFAHEDTVLVYSRPLAPVLLQALLVLVLLASTYLQRNEQSGSPGSESVLEWATSSHLCTCL